MAIEEYLSDNLVSFILFGITFMIVFRVINNGTIRGFKIPKGPSKIPFFGNVLALKRNDDMLNQLNDFSKQYGSVYSLYLGRKLVVIVNGWERIKEVTLDTGLEFADRGINVAFQDVNPNRLGIFDTLADEKWKTQRRFAHTTLRGMGFGKVSLEPVIKDEVNHTISYFKKRAGNPVNPMRGIGVCSFNIIYRLIFKRRVDHESDFADEQMKNVKDCLVADEGAILTLFPFLWPVMRYTGKWRNLYKANRRLCSFFHDEIRVRQERIESCQGEPEINDFVDAYLVQRKTAPESYTLDALDFVLLDLFLAGTDTTSNTMTWAIVYLVNNPDIQKKIHDEIIKEVGTQEVTWSHRSGLVYTQAALLEAQRMASVAAVIPRQAAVDATLGGYHLPKGTQLLLNMWSLHYDPDYWPEPTRFDPSRFLEPDGTLKQLPKSFLPFSAGKRSCMGEQLAKMELFLFFTTLLQQLRFSLAPGQNPPHYDGIMDFMRRPKDYHVTLSIWKD